ncbi:hypothetical protein [Marinomonas algarum]|uniref:Uncharacterized protein n=1 Tax=Marinomonas algarum TaxID=2883105 RepID=A0A9X1LFE8_9GAMM|nr:hypothetical protein [Marinomonas algarum]MCB5162948.1 hypothetical protein [Marinomonas algarum]
MQDIVIKHLQTRLSELGYPGCRFELEFKFDGTEQSGVAFFGSIETNDLKIITKRLFSANQHDTSVQRVRKVIMRRFLEKTWAILGDSPLDITIEALDAGSREVNQMMLIDDSELPFDFDIRDVEDLYQHQRCWTFLIRALKKDMVEVAKTLEEECYLLIQSEEE